MLVLLGNELNTELPLGVGSSVDGIVKISSVEVRILTGKLVVSVRYQSQVAFIIHLESLVPNERVGTEMRGPVVLDKGALPLRINKTEGVDWESGARLSARSSMP